MRGWGDSELELRGHKAWVSKVESRWVEGFTVTSKGQTKG